MLHVLTTNPARMHFASASADWLIS